MCLAFEVLICLLMSPAFHKYSEYMHSNCHFLLRCNSMQGKSSCTNCKTPGRNSYKIEAAAASWHPGVLLADMAPGLAIATTLFCKSCHENGPPILLWQFQFHGFGIPRMVVISPLEPPYGNKVFSTLGEHSSSKHALERLGIWVPFCGQGDH